MKGAATIDDVARKAGVAISTVSHVVNGTRFVSEATRMAVERAIVAGSGRSESPGRS
jgi:LacI family transcriptional regulator